MRHHHVAKALALTLLCLLLVPGCEQGDEPVQVALILSGASGHYWENIVEGAQTAAERMDIPLRCYMPDEEKEIRLEDLPAQAARDGADALVVASQGQQELLDALEGIDLPLIAVGTQIEGAEAAVLNDDAKMGQSVAQALAASLAEGDGVLLLADSAEYRETDLRETSLRENLAAKGVTVRGRFFSGDNREWAYRQTLQQLYLWPDLDAIVAFSAKATVGAAQAAQYLDRDIPIVGTDIAHRLHRGWVGGRDHRAQLLRHGVPGRGARRRGPARGADPGGADPLQRRGHARQPLYPGDREDRLSL